LPLQISCNAHDMLVLYPFWEKNANSTYIF